MRCKFCDWETFSEKDTCGICRVRLERGETLVEVTRISREESEKDDDSERGEDLAEATPR